MRSWYLVFLLVVCASPLPLKKGNVLTYTPAPIVGVLSQPYFLTNNEIGDYIAASYVKFLESGGARVVPIRFDWPTSRVLSVLSKVNGVLLPGGANYITNDTALYRAGSTIINRAIELNNAGVYFPIWGTCLGFELMASVIAGNDSVLCPHCFHTNNVSLPLDINPKNINQSRMFRGIAPSLLSAVASQNMTANVHTSGVLVETFDLLLSSSFTILSTNTDPTNPVARFVSTMEAISLPFYGTQWHPEKNNFEFSQSFFAHSREAVMLSEFLASFFVDECRMNNQAFASEQELNAALISNDCPTPDPKGYFDQIYLWPTNTTFSL